MRQATFLALREMRHEWLASLCFLAALIGGLAPLLLILALKNGVIDNMVDGLIEDPGNRELIAMGAGAHRPEFFDMLAARGDVGFVMPATRSINALANGLRNPVERRLERSVPLMPSAPGDPLLPEGMGVAPGRIVLSAPLAEALALKPGDEAEIMIGRDVDGRREDVRATWTVAGVLPQESYGRHLVLLSLSDLVAIERFRDDATITPDDWLATRPAPDRYASFRVYARRLQDIDTLRQALQAEGVETRPRAANAALLIGFRDNLAFLYTVIAILAIGGFWAAMAANLRGMVERQRISFSLLSLVGMRAGARRAIPMIQALVLVGGGIVLTLGLVALLIVAVNATFARSTGETVASLGLADVAMTLGLGGVVAISAALWARRAIDGVGPDEVLRSG